MGYGAYTNSQATSPRYSEIYAFLDMSPVICNLDKDNHDNLIKYREHLDKQIILLSDKYQLPKITGVGKQIPWAIDIRIKFIEAYDKRKSGLSPDTSHSFLEMVNSHVESRWWIDHKEMSFEDIITELRVDTKSDNKIQTTFVDNNKSDIADSIIIDTQDDRVLIVRSKKSDDVTLILEKYKFVFEVGGCEWIRNVSITDPERVGVVESLSLSLLQNGFTLRVITRPPPEIIHDGTISVVNNRLCIIARTEPVYKAASRLGSRIVWIDRKYVDELKDIIEKYDVDCTQEAHMYINEANL
jgi:hypothetical protein